jgi:uncharacterized protein YbaA (DUF1428 family)
MASYVDGFVIPIPKKHTALYRGIARRAERTWRDHGALGCVECIADDVKGRRMIYGGFKSQVEL